MLSSPSSITTATPGDPSATSGASAATDSEPAAAGTGTGTLAPLAGPTRPPAFPATSFRRAVSRRSTAEAWAASRRAMVGAFVVGPARRSWSRTPLRNCLHAARTNGSTNLASNSYAASSEPLPVRAVAGTGPHPAEASAKERALVVVHPKQLPPPGPARSSHHPCRPL